MARGGIYYIVSFALTVHPPIHQPTHQEEDEEDYMEGDYGGKGWADNDDDGAWIEVEDWDEGEDAWEEDVDLDFMDEL